MPPRSSSAWVRPKVNSRSPKRWSTGRGAESNAVYKAWNQVRDFVKRDGSRPVPDRLRNAPTKLMKGLGIGEGYRYAHDEPGAYAAASATARRSGEQRFYEPAPRGSTAHRRAPGRTARARHDGEEPR